MEKIKDLVIVRENFDLENLSSLVERRGDLSRVSTELGVNSGVLSNAIKEYRILSIFPNIEKSKANPLSTFKINRELKLFARYHRISKLSHRKLCDKIRKWKIKIGKNPKILLKNLQHDLIIGSTIGDAYIRQRETNCNFRVSHSKKQEEYLLWKYKVMREFTLSEPKWNSREIRGRMEKMLELATFTHPVFNYYRKLFYKNDIKTIIRNTLEFLNPRSLAIWICDDGSYNNKQGYIVLCTNSYSLEEHKIMKKYFNEVWGLDPTIGFRDGKYYYLRFKQGDSKKLIKIIELFIPRHCMKYKIGK